MSRILLIIAIGSFFYSCKKPSGASSSGPYGRELAEADPCQALPDEASDARFFMQSGSGTSLDREQSMDNARQLVRRRLAEDIETRVMKVVGAYNKLSGRSNSINNGEVVNNILAGIYTYCTKTFQADNGIYTSFVGMWIDKEELKSHLKSKLEHNGSIQNDAYLRAFNSAF